VRCRDRLVSLRTHEISASAQAWFGLC